MLDQTPDLKKIAWLATDQLPDRAEDQWQLPDVHGDTLAFLQYTSGSTGTPKGVMLTHANLMHNSASIAYAFEHTRSGSGVFWLPSYHDMGLIGGILQPLYIGQANVLLSPMSFLQKPYRWLQAISRYRCTISGGPNFAYDLCVRKITPEQRDTLDLSRWCLAFNGAEPVRAETLDQFAKMFEPCGFRREAFYPCYGMAEATLIVSGGFKAALPVIRTFDAEALENNQVLDALADEEGARELVGSGGNLLDQRIVIADPETSDHACRADQVGEIWVSGPSVAQGYWNRPEETERTFRAYLNDTGEGPFLRTGDLGFMQDGELFITGRLKDLIIIRGLNHYPQDIELTVGKSHPRLAAGQRRGVCRRDRRRRAAGVVHEIERRQQRDLEGVFEAIRRDVAAEHELPVEAIVLIKAGSIPKTSSGKIQRHACRAGLSRRLAGGRRPVARLDVRRRRRAGERPACRDAADSGRRTTRRSATRGRGASCANGAAATQPRPGPALSTAEIVLEHVRRVAKERARRHHARQLDRRAGARFAGADGNHRSLEDTYGGRFPEDVLPQIETCREVAAAVETYLGPRRGPAPISRVIHEIPPENYRFEYFPEYPASCEQMIDEIDAAGLEKSVLQGPRGRDQRHDEDRRPRADQLLQLQLRRHVGRSAGRGGRPSGPSTATAPASRPAGWCRAKRRSTASWSRRLARFVGAEAAIVFVGGHGTNETTLGHLFGPGDLILHDALAHNSIMQGAMLSGARRRAFPHNDWRGARQAAGRAAARPIAAW